MKIGSDHQKRVIKFVYLSLVCLLAFLGGFSFLGTRGAWLLALGTVVLIKQFFAKQIHVSVPFAVTIIFSMMLFVFRTVYSTFEFSYLVAYAIVPVAMFSLGTESSRSRKELYAIVFSVAFGHVAFVTANVFYTLHSGIVVYPKDGLLTYLNFWTHEAQPRTFFSIDTTIVAGLGAALLVYPGRGKNWLLRLSGGLLLAAYITFATILGIRSPIVVAPIALIITAFYSLLKEPSKKRRNIWLAIWGGGIVVFGLFWALTANNIFGLKDFLLKIPGFNRFIAEGGSDDARIRHYEIFAQNWLDYPLGGMYQAGLLGKDSYGNLVFFHNGFLQVYTHGGFPLTVVAIVLLVLLARQIVLVKRTPENGACLTLSVSIIAAIFGIFMIEPMINSGPFISSYLFLAGGYLAGQLAKQRNEKPFFSLGLNDWEGSYPSPSKSLIRLALFILSGIADGVLVFVTSGSPFYALFSLAVFVLVFLLLDKNQYNAVSWVKTAVSLAFATAIVVLEFRLLPNPSLLLSIAKVMIGFFSFLLVRVIIIQKRDPEDGYRALRNLFVSISKDVSLTEENLVN